MFFSVLQIVDLICCKSWRSPRLQCDVAHPMRLLAAQACSPLRAGVASPVPPLLCCSRPTGLHAEDGCEASDGDDQAMGTTSAVGEGGDATWDGRVVRDEGSRHGEGHTFRESSPYAMSCGGGGGSDGTGGRVSVSGGTDCRAFDGFHPHRTFEH